MKKFLALLMALAMTLGLAACGGDTGAASTPASTPDASVSTPASTPDASDEQSDADVEKIMTLGLTADITPLNCVDPSSETAARINNIMYPTLTSAAQNAEGKLEVVYQLLESCTTEDNKTFTLKLREDVCWSDGEPVTAEDVVFSIDLFTDPAVGSTSMATYLIMLDGITDTKKGYRDADTELTSAYVVDEYTLNIVCSDEYDEDFVINRLCYNLYALPQHILGGIERSELINSQAAVDSKVVYGAFYVHSYATASELVLAANENYYLGAPKLDYLRILFLDSSQITTMLASGDLDIAYPGTIDAADYEYVRSLENVTTEIGAPNSVVSLFLNNESIPDVNVRKAISLAIDRAAIVDGILGGYGEVSNQPVSSSSAYLSPEHSTPVYDVEQAKQLVADSGFNQPLTITVTTGNTTMRNVAALIQSSLAEIGLTVEIESADNAVLACLMGKYDMVIITQTEQPLTPSHTLGIHLNNGAWTKYATEESVALYKALTAPTTDEELTQIMYDLQEIVATDYPSVPMYNATVLLAKSNNVLVGGPASYGMLVNIHEWDVAG